MIRPMRGGGRTLRALALLAPGALAVHELRYLVAYGGDAQRTLDHEGHHYLAALTPLVSLLLAATLAHLLVRLASGQRRAAFTSLALWLLSQANQ